MPDNPALPRRPSVFSAGADLPVGTYHAMPVEAGYTVARTVGAITWYPLTQRDNPAWRIWPSRTAALQWIERQDVDLSDYPFWGQ